MYLSGDAEAATAAESLCKCQERYAELMQGQAAPQNLWRVVSMETATIFAGKKSAEQRNELALAAQAEADAQARLEAWGH